MHLFLKETKNRDNKLHLDNIDTFLDLLYTLLIKDKTFECTAYHALRRINANSSPVPDPNPNRVWPEIAFELAPVVCDIYNSSITKGLSRPN